MSSASSSALGAHRRVGGFLKALSSQVKASKPQMEKASELSFLGPIPRPGIPTRLRVVSFSIFLALLFAGAKSIKFFQPVNSYQTSVLSRCSSLSMNAGPPSNFHQRSQSDRFVPGTKPTLLKNARIWTGAENGTEVVRGDILIDKGLIKAVGHLSQYDLKTYDDLEVVNVHGAWVTPGIVDLHSHIGNGASPDLNGADDTNSIKGTIMPWLRRYVRAPYKR